MVSEELKYFVLAAMAPSLFKHTRQARLFPPAAHVWSRVCVCSVLLKTPARYFTPPSHWQWAFCTLQACSLLPAVHLLPYSFGEIGWKRRLSWADVSLCLT